MRNEVQRLIFGSNVAEKGDDDN